jgi:hypothetical protein
MAAAAGIIDLAEQLNFEVIKLNDGYKWAVIHCDPNYEHTVTYDLPKRTVSKTCMSFTWMFSCD